MNKPTLLQESPDFSLVLGGPLYQLFRRALVSGDALELLHRRILAFWALTWLPLLCLSFFGGQALGGAIKIPFLHDLEAQVRFLVALPVLIAAELIVHLRIRPVVQRFVERRIVIPEELPKFHAAIDSAVRLRNSVPLEIGLVILVWTVGHWIWRSQIALGADSWYATLAGTHWHLTAAGYWYAFVSIPIFQFILLRWYLRLLIWFRFLWQVSRLHLRLTSTHPDRAGGLAFLGKSSYAFGPILFAQGALLAGLIASRVLYQGESLLSFKMEAISLVGFFVLFILGPLIMFTPQLSRAKRSGLGEYGLLAGRYVQGFEEKWVRGKAAESDELLGSGDIQSLADLGNSYAVVREMRVVPFGLEDITRLAVATAAPLLPLGLTILSLEDLILRLIKIVF
jgi:hypothetical protein